MFYYYGRKKRIAHLYPSPLHDTIIEPFAGSAAYSLHGNNWKKQVIISDIDHTIIRIWRYLQQASKQDIQSLPDMKLGDKTTDHKQLTPVERDLIGLHINPGSSTPKITCSLFNKWPEGKKYILENLFKIKHWTILHQSYKKIGNQIATWYIDPPYQVAGVYYSKGKSIDFSSLAIWCLIRKGQVIVCESDDARWLPFKPLVVARNATSKTYKEVIFYREK